MSKLQNVYLVRHGQSTANVNKAVHYEMPDHAIPLSELGKRQAVAAGHALNEVIDDLFGQGPMRMWVSPYLRTRQTADGIESVLAKHIKAAMVPRSENIALCEQQFGLFDGIPDEELSEHFPREHAHYKLAEDFDGKFWPRMPMGESRFDVAMRVQTSFATFKEQAEEDGIRNIIVVTHGVAMRAFIMQWRNHPYEWFERETNPGNCDVYRLAANPTLDGYVHKTTLLD